MNIVCDCHNETFKLKLNYGELVVICTACGITIPVIELSKKMNLTQ